MALAPFLLAVLPTKKPTLEVAYLGVWKWFSFVRSEELLPTITEAEFRSSNDDLSPPRSLWNCLLYEALAKISCYADLSAVFCVSWLSIGREVAKLANSPRLASLGSTYLALQCIHLTSLPTVLVGSYSMQVLLYS